MDVANTWTTITCPYCWERLEIPLDIPPEERNISMVEDCHVCCQPIIVTVVVGEGGEVVNVDAERENS
jgi:hypothetical protein